MDYRMRACRNASTTGNKPWAASIRRRELWLPRWRDVQDLELRHVAVIVIAARHAHVAEDELREEGEIESDEYDERARRAQPSG